MYGTQQSYTIGYASLMLCITVCGYVLKHLVFISGTCAVVMHYRYLFPCAGLTQVLVVQSKEHHVARHQGLHLVMVHPLPMVQLHSMLQPSQPMVVTQATLLLLLPLRLTQAMAAVTPRRVLMVATHKSQQLPMAAKHHMVEPVLEDMTRMVHRVSSLMEVQVVMVSKVVSPVHSQQQQAVVGSGRNSRTMRAGLTTTTRSLVSASGIAQQTCKQLAAAALVFFSSILVCQLRSGKTECSCAWSI